MTEQALAQREPSLRDWIAVLSAMLGAFMAVIDILITNASLKEIQAALGATISEGSWISTSYLVGEIIIIPLTVWLISLLGARRLTVWLSIGFISASLLCSHAWSLHSMIAFRAMQGLCGGAFIPLAFSMVLTHLPPHRRPIGMALFAVTATFAPAIGPSIGGWLTEHLGWQYLFYINLPPGLLMICGLLYGLEKRAIDWRQIRRADYAGICSMALGLGCLQVFLEEGYRSDWFSSRLIVVLALIAFVSLGCFLIIQLSRQHPLLNLRILKDRNFALSCIAAVGLGIGLYGSIYALPLYLSQIQNYSPLQIGELIMWMGLPQLALIPFVPLLMRFIDPRLLCAIGFMLFGYASFISGSLNPDLSGPQLLHIQLIRAVGQPLILITSSLIATSYLEHKDSGDASALFNILRNLSGAIFIALLMTMLQNDTNRNYQYLGESLSNLNPQALERLEWLTEKLGSSQRALAVLSQEIREQASILAYNEAFHIMGCALVISVVAILSTRRLPPGLKPGEIH
ncbi:DHA2 family efflux MFS transporter permease subunit [Pseudomonas sp. NCHU5208]|uniref:DHA2 family efflux MFS transporter permease subunit n=1 Tax=unclassified Pseudomonas TaxID=196821 RepID=UPI003F98926A